MQKTYQSTLSVRMVPQDTLSDAENLMKKSEFEKAFDLIEDDDSFEALKLKAEILKNLKDYKNAVKCLDEALDMQSDDDLMYMKADILYRWAKVTYFPDSNFDKALDLIESALEISPDGEDSPEYWFLKGEIYQSMENHIDARRCFLKAENRLEELKDFESELELFEVYADETLINITGVNFYRGIDVFEKGTVLKLSRDDDNEHDSDAVACLLDDEVVGYVANSDYTLINNVKSASDIRSSLKDSSESEVLFVFQSEFVIAKVIF